MKLQHLFTFFFNLVCLKLWKETPLFFFQNKAAWTDFRPVFPIGLTVNQPLVWGEAIPQRMARHPTASWFQLWRYEALLLQLLSSPGILILGSKWSSIVARGSCATKNLWSSPLSLVCPEVSSGHWMITSSWLSPFALVDVPMTRSTSPVSAGEKAFILWSANWHDHRRRQHRRLKFLLKSLSQSTESLWLGILLRGRGTAIRIIDQENLTKQSWQELGVVFSHLQSTTHFCSGHV